MEGLFRLITTSRRWHRTNRASIALLLLSAIPAVGQSPSFRFLETPVSARMAALGGVNVSLRDRDLAFFYANPALSGDTLAGIGSLAYRVFPSRVGQAAITYAHRFRTVGVLTFGVQHLNYGTLEGYDDTGTPTGKFSASETAVSAGKSHQIGNIRLAAAIKGVFSTYAGFRASAVAIDAGGVFVHPVHDMTVGLVIRNAGLVLSEFSPTSSTILPFDVQAGASFKPEHMPLRFSITAYDLVRRVPSPAGQTTRERPADKVLRHAAFGVEVLVHRRASVLVGYNHRMQNELLLEQGGGGAGISAGLSVSGGNVDFVFSRTGYVAGYASYSFTLSANLSKFIKRH